MLDPAADLSVTDVQQTLLCPYAGWVKPAHTHQCDVHEDEYREEGCCARFTDFYLAGPGLCWEAFQAGTFLRCATEIPPPRVRYLMFDVRAKEGSSPFFGRGMSLVGDWKRGRLWRFLGYCHVTVI